MNTTKSINSTHPLSTNATSPDTVTPAEEALDNETRVDAKDASGDNYTVPAVQNIKGPKDTVTDDG